MNEYPLLSPSYLMAAMRHDQTFQHAAAMLHDDWDPNEGGLFREMLQAPDIEWHGHCSKPAWLREGGN